MLDDPLLPTRARPSRNLDSFLRAVYAYWSKKGLMCSLLTEVSDLVVSLFVALLLVFLCAIDYAALKRRVMHNECPDGTLNVADVFHADCYGDQPVQLNRLGSPAFWLTFGLVGVFWACALGAFFFRIPKLLRMRAFFRDELEVDERHVQTISWDSICSRLTRCNLASEPLNALQICNCVTRASNYKIGLFNEVLDTDYFPKSLEFCIDYAFRRVVYNARRDVCIHAHNVDESAEKLARWFRVIAIVNLVLAPGIFIFRGAVFIFRYVDDWRRRPGSIASRTWSRAARWKLRHYCELDHAFDQRMRLAHGAAMRYTSLFTSEAAGLASRSVLVICGGFVVVNLCLAFLLDDGYLTVELSPGRSVAFWLGLVGMVMAIASSLVPDELRIFDPVTKLEDVAKHTHYYPDAWKGAEATLDTYGSVVGLFPYKLRQFVAELLSVVITPYVLAFVLPKKARAIAVFFAKTTRRCRVIGDVCRYALFEGDSNPKMEMSMLFFQDNNPSWAPTTEWQRSLLDQRDDYLTQSLTTHESVVLGE